MNPNTYKTLSLIELVIIIVVIVLDISVPTLVLLAFMTISLLIRKEGLSSLGFKQSPNFLKMAILILLLSVLWSLFHLSITMPILNHLTGTTQNLSMFSDLKDNLPKLGLFLIFTWSLAAFGEEIVYRGYIQKTVDSIFGTNKSRLISSLLVSSLLFGIAHTEQGFIGIVLTFLDAVFFSYIKYKFGGNIWAPILAHGFNNTIGLVAFYFVGPIYGFW